MSDEYGNYVFIFDGSKRRGRYVKAPTPVSVRDSSPRTRPGSETGPRSALPLGDACRRID
eukprot:199219-Heterocapsa_arctica.AAC.2